MERAGVPRETARGVVDFHALRHTFATLLAESGASLVVAQRLMRHSDPSLTSGVYTHVSDAMGRGAVDGLLG